MWQKNSPNGSGREHLNHFCMAMDQETWNELLERLKASAIAIEEGPVPRWVRSAPVFQSIFATLKETLSKLGIMTNLVM